MWLARPIQATMDGERPIVDFVTRSRVYVLPAAALIIWATPSWYGAAPSWNSVPSVLLACFGIYQINRVYDIVEDEINDPVAYANTAAAGTAVRYMGVCSLLASLFLSVVLLNYLASAALAVMMVLGVLYSVPFLRGRRGAPQRLKQVPWLKNAVPSIVWPFTTILYPAMSGPAARLPQLLLCFAEVACCIFTIEVACDVRDSLGDKAAGVRSLVTAFGARRALLVPLAVAGATALLIVGLVCTDWLPAPWLLPSVLLVSLPVIACRWRESLANDRRWSHILVLINIVALIPLGLVGSWVE
jgi:4-hydroxybenzoate polyprenyltransferase